MKSILALLISLPLLAQEPPKPEEKAKEAPKQEAAKSETAKPEAAAAESPKPATEQWLSGNIDFGYRWRSDVRGNVNAYRSVVNLRQGPELSGWEFTVLDPKKRLFDRLETRGSSWGSEPYNSAHLTARKLGLYDLSADYRNIAYFNNLPSFADPLMDVSRGFFLNERSFDIRRRLADVQLDLFPGRRIIPYLAFNHSSGDGRGVTTFVANANEYAVADELRDRTENYRGGVRVEMHRYHLTLEQGGATFKDDQRAFNSDRNTGNRVFVPPSQQLFLSNLNQAYGIRGDTIYSKLLLSANPVSWADLYGQFLYSQPDTTTKYSQVNTGLFQLTPLLLYTGQQNLLTAQAKQPHTSGNLGTELRPFRRLRIIESWMTDRLHNAAFSFLTEQLLTATPTTITELLPDRLVLNYNRQQVDVLVDVTSKLTLRGGHRYVWGDAAVRAPQLSPTGGLDSRELRQQVVLGGASFRPSQKLSVNFDIEGAAGDRSYFRTSLHDYIKAKARARYQFSPWLAIAASGSGLSNTNPSGYNYDFKDESLSLFLTPGAGKRVSLMADYTHSSLLSNISFLIPQDLSGAVSRYRDNAHTGTAVADVTLPGYAGLTPRLALGGSFFVSSGSRPSRYYQPLARVSVPLQKHVSWNSEWRWYGFGEGFYLYEGFRAHVFMTGLRLSR